MLKKGDWNLKIFKLCSLHVKFHGEEDTFAEGICFQIAPPVSLRQTLGGVFSQRLTEHLLLCGWQAQTATKLLQDFPLFSHLPRVHCPCLALAGP